MNDTLESIVRSRCEDMLLVSQAVDTCLDAFEQACEPRPPKAEWFGTGPGQWDAWWIESWGVLRKVRLDEDGGLEGVNEAGELVSMYFDPACNVVPVEKEGFPAPVGWQVVGE